MMQVLYPTYTLKVVIQDRRADPVPGQITQVQDLSQLQALSNGGAPYRFYGAYGEKTGCDDVLKAVKDALLKANIAGGVTVTFERFEHK